MKIKIDQIVDHGTLESERVEMSVIEDTDLKYYIIADTTFVGENISNKLRHMHWFVPKAVKSGDEVHLYTKKGTDSSLKISDENERHLIHWKLGTPVWNNDGDAAVLFHANSWKTTKTKETD